MRFSPTSVSAPSAAVGGGKEVEQCAHLHLDVPAVPARGAGVELACVWEDDARSVLLFPCPCLYFLSSMLLPVCSNAGTTPALVQLRQDVISGQHAPPTTAMSHAVGRCGVLLRSARGEGSRGQ